MKKKLIIIVVLVLSCFLVGCELFNPHKNEPQYKIYEMAKEVGYEGTYEEWLNTIRGIDGTSIVKVELDKDSNLIITLSNGEVINVGNVKGDKGEEVEISVIDGYIKWHYKNSNEWYNLIEVKTLIGEKGDKGEEVEISVTDGYIKWHYKNSNEWYNLIEVKTLIGLQGEKGNDGVSIVKTELDKDSNLIITLSNGKVINVGNVKGDKGEEVEISVIDGYIKWHYKNSNEWYNLIEVKTLIGEKGDKGEEVEISVVDGYIKWHYKNSNEWYNLIEVKNLIGEKGKSAYEIYKEKHPEYTKSEEEWLDDLVNGRLATKEVHTVKFITNTIDIIEDQKVEDNKKIIKPNDPVKKGYTFIGWFNEYNEQWVFGGYNVTSDVTLYAKYTPNKYKITLDNDVIIEVTYDSSFTLPVIDKEGYRFKYFEYEGKEFKDTIYTFDKDINVTSVYGPLFTLTFDTDGGEEIEKVEYHESNITSLPEAKKDGCVFIGWYLDNELFNVPFTNTNLIDITLKAHYRSVVGDYEVEELENGEIKILKYKGTDKEVTIPNKINNKTVTILGESSFKDNKEIERVILSKDIKEIDDNVFNGCTNLKEVIFNTGILTYKDNILLNCTTLESITIDVLNQALVGFFDYEESNIPETFININFLSKDKASNTSKMFNNMSSHLFSINIPGSWEVVPSSYFQNNTLIKEVNIEEGITIINYYAFASCSSLQTINLPNSITSIGSSAFSYCKSLQSIILPNELIEISNKSFTYCTSLKLIVLPNAITKIGSSAFYQCTSLQSITLPNSITNIGDYAFSYCSSLSDMFYGGSKSDFINKITIGTNNSSLTNANIHYNSNVTLEYVQTKKYSYILTSENEIYYLNCYDRGIETFNFKKDFANYNIKSLAYFSSFYLLTIVTLPNTLEKINKSQFSECPSLSKIYFQGKTKEEFDSLLTGWSKEFDSATVYLYSETKPTQAGKYWHYIDDVIVEWDENFIDDSTEINTSNLSVIKQNKKLKNKIYDINSFNINNLYLDLVDNKGLIVQISLDEKIVSTSDLEKLSSVGNHIITINYGSLSCDYSIHLVDMNEEYDITFIDIDETIVNETKKKYGETITVTLPNDFNNKKFVCIKLNDKIISYDNVINVSSNQSLQYQVVYENEHDFIETTLDDPCSDSIYVKKVCKNCEYETIICIKEVEATHSFSSWIEEVKPTCEEDGMKAHFECTKCKKIFDENYNEINDYVIQKLGHDYSESKVDEPCVSYMLYQCTRCDYEYKDYCFGEPSHNFSKDTCIDCGFNEFLTESQTIEYQDFIVKIKDDTAYVMTYIGDGVKIDMPDRVLFDKIVYKTDYSYFISLIVLEQYKEMTEQLIIPNNYIGIIPDRCFTDFNKLTMLIIGDGVTKLDMMCFANCKNLERIAIGENVSGFGNFVFYGCQKLEYIYYNCKRAVRCSVNGNFAPFCFTGHESSGITLKIGDNVEYLMDGLFRPHDFLNETYANITRVEISANSKLNELDTFCFEYCDIKEFYLPTTCINISSSAFSNGSIEKLYYYGTSDDWYAVESLKNIPAKTVYFYSEEAPNKADDFNDYQLLENNDNDETQYTLVGYYGAKDTIMIPSSCNEIKITKISNSAFSGTNLKTIIIGTNIDNIEEGTFNNASQLINIIYLGNINQWKKIYNGDVPNNVTLICINGSSNYWHDVNGTTTIW